MSAVKKRFMAKVKRNKNGCWDWQSYTKANYGGFYMDGDNKYAHRVSYTLFVGPIPPDGYIHHRCSNKLCVNPEHLQCTTWEQNLAEMCSRQALLKKIARLEKEIEKLRSAKCM